MLEFLSNSLWREKISTLLGVFCVVALIGVLGLTTYRVQQPTKLPSEAAPSCKYGCYLRWFKDSTSYTPIDWKGSPFNQCLSKYEKTGVICNMGSWWPGGWQTWQYGLYLSNGAVLPRELREKWFKSVKVSPDLISEALYCGECVDFSLVFEMTQDWLKDCKSWSQGQTGSDFKLVKEVYAVTPTRQPTPTKAPLPEPAPSPMVSIWDSFNNCTSEDPQIILGPEAPAPTPEPTATPTPVGDIPCDSQCNPTAPGNDCVPGLECATVDGSDVCRNPDCPDEKDCICPTQPTPTITPVPTLTPTSGEGQVVGRVKEVVGGKDNFWQDQQWYGQYTCGDKVGLMEITKENVWGCNPDPYFETKDFDTSDIHDITLSPPDGYTCEGWSLSYYDEDGNLISTDSGAGCSTGKITILPKDKDTYASRTHLWFTIVSKTATPTPTPSPTPTPEVRVPFTPTPVQADITGDGYVDGADASVLVANWGIDNPDPRADLNDDEKVNAIDASILITNWSPR